MDVRKNKVDSNPRPWARGMAHAWAIMALSIVLVGLSATALTTMSALRSVRATDRARFEQISERVVNEVTRRMRQYTYGLRGARGLWPASKLVERDEFREMVRSRDLPVEFKGALGLGFIRYVKRTELDSFLEKTRKDGAPGFHLRTEGDADDLFVIEYIEPLAENMSAQGYDVGSEINRRIAAERAMRTGLPMLTEPITLVQAADKGPGFLIYLPVYKKGMPVSTVAERTAAIEGWTYMPVVASRTMEGVQQLTGDEVDFHIFQGERADDQYLIYDSDGHLSVGPRITTLTDDHRHEDSWQQMQTILGQKWTVRTTMLPTFVRASRLGVYATAGGGLAATALSAGLIVAYGRTARRARRMAETMTRELKVSKEQAERLALVAKRTTNAVLITDADRRVIWANDGFTRISGYSFEEAEGRSPGELLQSGSTDSLTVMAMRACLSAGQPFRGEILNRGKSGREYWLDIDIQPLHDEQGRLSGFMAIESEITEQVEARNQMRSIFAAVAEGIVLQNASGEIVECNAAAERILGLKRDAMCGRTSYDERWCSIREDGSPYPGAEHPTSLTLATGRSVRGQVMGIRTPQGEVRWISVSTEPLRDAGGVVTAVVASFADITLLRSQQHRLDLVLSGAGLGTWDWNIATGEVEFNARWAEMLGFEHGEIEPHVRSWERLVHPNDLPMVMRVLGDHLEGRTPEYRCEHRLKRKDGSWAWVLDAGRVIERGLDNKPVRAAGVHVDISEAKQLEVSLAEAKTAAEAASHAKSEFLANMSHEIRTPMTAILGYSELLQSEFAGKAGNEGAIESLSTIRRNAEHLLSIINDILDVSKIEAGKMTVERIPVRPDQVIHEVVSLMNVKSKEKGLRLEARFDSPIPEVINSDPLRLRQILTNLVGNALKFTSEGGVTIAARMIDGEKIRIDISDTGIGLAPENMGKLFDAFTQADSSTTRKYGGTGLGLRISKRLAEMLGGTITATSELGKGSTFSVTIDAGDTQGFAMIPTGALNVVCQNGNVPTAVRAGAASAVTLQGVRILLAEDGPDNTRLIVHHLTRAGAVVTAVENGKLALEKLQDPNGTGGELMAEPVFDLVLTDMQMPVMDGYALTRVLRNRGCDLPIVALTAHAMTGDLEKCLAAGCSDYASKPIDRLKLLAVCRHAVDENAKTKALKQSV